MEQLELPFKEGLPKTNAELNANKKRFAGNVGDKIVKEFTFIDRTPFSWNGLIARAYKLEDTEGFIYKYNVWDETKVIMSHFKGKCSIKNTFWDKGGIATTVVERMKEIYD